MWPLSGYVWGEIPGYPHKEYPLGKVASRKSRKQVPHFDRVFYLRMEEMTLLELFLGTLSESYLCGDHIGIGLEVYSIREAI